MIALVVPARVAVHAATFLFGVIFFSQPILAKVTYAFTHRFPHWRNILELRR